MKERKIGSPMQIIAPMFLLGFWSTWYLFQALNYGTDTLEIWLQVLIVTFAFGLMGVSLVFNILILKNKNFRKGDELTEKCMRKAGLLSFTCMVSLISFFFIALQFVVLFSGDGSQASGINDLIDVRIVLSAMAFVQIVGTFLFAVLTFVYSKKVNTDGI